MKLSVIIPTHNRADILKKTLEKLFAQKGVDFEIIVVDDGSTDNTKNIIGNLKFKIENLKFIKQSASHQGIARNRGVKEAKGEIIVFIGDDIFVESDFLRKHLELHMEHPDENVVVLGHTTWDPAIGVNDYMRFLEDSGWQFGYGFLNPGMIGKTEPYKFFYTSNISIKKSFFEKEKFNEDFKVYGWEDVELGYRLYKNHDMRVYYEPDAKAFHHHEILPSGLPKKMHSVGASAVHFQRLHPELKVIPMGLKKRIINLAANSLISPFSRLLGKKIYYKIQSWKEFMKGVG